MAKRPFDDHALHAIRAQPGAFARLFAFFAAAILVFQLVGLAQHKHETKRHFVDCASCVLAAQLQSPPPDPVLVEHLIKVAVLQYILPTQVLADIDRSTDKPLPRAQGPPASVTA